MKNRFSLYAALFLMTSAACAQDIPGISDSDAARLDLMEDMRTKAMVTAKGGEASDLAQLEQAYAGSPQKIVPRDLLGTWSCQTFKIGGGLALVAYSPFKCRITLVKGELQFRKISGSQRTAGKLFVKSDTQLIYLGAKTYNDDPLKPYGLGPDSDDTAVVESFGKNRLVFQFPAPERESDFDVMWLKKTGK